MRVNSINNINRIKFSSNVLSNKGQKDNKLNSDELMIKKTMKTAHVCQILLIGIVLLYFDIMRNHKINKKIALESLINKKAQTHKPIIENAANLII